MNAVHPIMAQALRGIAPMTVEERLLRDVLDAIDPQDRIALTREHHDRAIRQITHALDRAFERGQMEGRR